MLGVQGSIVLRGWQNNRGNRITKPERGIRTCRVTGVSELWHSGGSCMPVGSPVLVAAPSATDFFHRGSGRRGRRRRLRQWQREGHQKLWKQWGKDALGSGANALALRWGQK